MGSVTAVPPIKALGSVSMPAYGWAADAYSTRRIIRTGLLTLPVS